MYRYISTIFLFIIHLSLEADVDFCKKEYDCSSGQKHTICQLKHNCGKGPNCTQFTSIPLSDKEKNTLLDIHNKLRNKQALGKGLKSLEGKPYPTAANMKEMVWDDELEFSAQCWANQCPIGHDTCRKKSGGVEVGQNLAYNSKNVIVQMVEEFYKEASKMPVALIDRFDQNYRKNVIGHFTQVVFWNSSLLGCGRSKFFFPNFNGVAVFLACNYGWAGNWDGQYVYKKGKPCSDCPKSTKCHKKHKGLCMTKPSKSQIPNICKFSKDKNCKPILGKPKTGGKDKKEEEGSGKKKVKKGKKDINDGKDKNNKNDKKDKKNKNDKKAKKNKKDAKDKNGKNDKKDKVDNKDKKDEDKEVKDTPKKSGKDKSEKNKPKDSKKDKSKKCKGEGESEGTDKSKSINTDSEDIHICKNVSGVCIIERKIVVINSSISYFKRSKGDLLAVTFVCFTIQYIYK